MPGTRLCTDFLCRTAATDSDGGGRYPRPGHYPCRTGSDAPRPAIQPRHTEPSDSSTTGRCPFGLPGNACLYRSGRRKCPPKYYRASDGFYRLPGRQHHAKSQIREQPCRTGKAKRPPSSAAGLPKADANRADRLRFARR